MSEMVYLYSEETLLHDPPPISFDIGGRSITFGDSFVANARLTLQAHEVLEASGVLARMDLVEPAPIDDALLRTVHDGSYVDLLHEACMASSKTFDLWSPLSPATWRAATLNCGASAQAAERVLDGTYRRALVNGRPAGHHATRSEAMGACYLNDLACAAEAALRAGAQRVMIVDWDVHTGNGAESIFWDRSDVLALSIHQEAWYPENSGRADMVGGANAAGFTVNVPLPAATADAGYLAALEHVVAPIARGFRPDLIVLGAGQDPSFYDPQARMLVSMAGFRKMAASVSALADEVCQGRIVCSLQGGYSPVYAPLCATAVAEGLLGVSDADALADPFEGDTEWLVTQRPLSSDAAAAIHAVQAAQREFWPALRNGSRLRETPAHA
jgi:acetoin utilization deacetylase AcuC-like enzyme